jgi:hypothetical protein
VRVTERDAIGPRLAHQLRGAPQPDRTSAASGRDAAGGPIVTVTAETHPFQAEVSQVLSLVVNSLYTHKEVFLRELVSNASDALDQLSFKALTNPDLTRDDPGLEIEIVPDKTARTLTIRKRTSLTILFIENGKLSNSNFIAAAKQNLFDPFSINECTIERIKINQEILSIWILFNFNMPS